MLLVATGALGLGFGLTLGSISTYAGAFMPDRRDVALTALNVLLGLGQGPVAVLIALFTSAGQWWYLPLLAAAGLAALIVITLVQPMDVPVPTGERVVRDGELGPRSRRCSGCSWPPWSSMASVKPCSVIGDYPADRQGSIGHVGQ